MAKHSGDGTSQLPIMLLGAMVIVCVLMYVMSRSRTSDMFVSTKQIPEYPYSARLPASQYNSLMVFKKQQSCDSCFYYGLQSAQADALYAISVGNATPAQHVLPPTIAMLNAHNADNSAVAMMPLQVSLLNAAAKIYGAQLRGKPRCGEYCSDTVADERLWTAPTSVELAQLWSAVASFKATASPTQVLVYGAMRAAVPTAAQVSLLGLNSQQIALADASMVNPNIAQITLLAASAAISAGKATPMQVAYYKNATPFLVSQFNAAIVASAGNVAAPEQLKLLASLPPPVSSVLPPPPPAAAAVPAAAAATAVPVKASPFATYI